MWKEGPPLNPHYIAAVWARELPGGFAGIYRDPTNSSRHVVFLQDTALTPALLRTIEERITAYYRRPIDLTQARRRQARWNAAQLYDWYRYLMPRAFGVRHAHGAGIDPVQNRLLFYAATDGAADSLASFLRSLALPCGLIEISIQPMVIIPSGPSSTVRRYRRAL